MKFEELKNNLKVKVCRAYLLSGVDEFLLSSAYNLIVKYANISMPDLNIIKFSEGIIDIDDVIRAMDTMPVFCDKKIVYLDIRMSKKSEIQNSKKLDEYFSNSSQNSVLIVNIGSNADVVFFDKKNFVEIDCNRLGIKIVSLKIKQLVSRYDKSIDEKAIALLYNYTLGDLSRITMEIDKLTQFVGDRGEIDIQDVKTLVTPSLEYQIYELTDALAKKNSQRVFTILNDIKFRKDEYRSLPALISAHFRKLFLVSVSTNSSIELSKMLGIKEYAIKMTLAQVKLFSKSNLKRIHELCVKLDFDLKQNNISIDNAINLIVMTILNI